MKVAPAPTPYHGSAPTPFPVWVQDGKFDEDLTPTLWSFVPGRSPANAYRDELITLPAERWESELEAGPPSSYSRRAVSAARATGQGFRPPALVPSARRPAAPSLEDFVRLVRVLGLVLLVFGTRFFERIRASIVAWLPEPSADPAIALRRAHILQVCTTALATCLALTTGYLLGQSEKPAPASGPECSSVPQASQLEARPTAREGVLAGTAANAGGLSNANAWASAPPSQGQVREETSRRDRLPEVRPFPVERTPRVDVDDLPIERLR